MSSLRWTVPCLAPHLLDKDFPAVDYSSGDTIQECLFTEVCCSAFLEVLLCEKPSRNVCGCPFSLFLKDRFLFTSQLQAGSAHRFIQSQGCVCTCVFFLWWFFFFFFEKNIVVAANS